MVVGVQFQAYAFQWFPIGLLLVSYVASIASGSGCATLSADHISAV